MAKLAHYCCDPRFHPEPRVVTPDGQPCTECDPNYHFYGSEGQAKQKRDRVREKMTKAEGHID